MLDLRSREPHPNTDPFHVTRGRERRPLRYEPPELVATYGAKFLERLERPEMDPRNLEGYYRTCWNWRGYVQPDGYAYFNTRGVHHPVQRFAYELWVNRVPPDLIAHGECGSRLCCAPHHLLLRQRHPLAQLSAEAKATIALFYRQGDVAGRRWSQDELAAKFGVSRWTIARALADTDA